MRQPTLFEVQTIGAPYQPSSPTSIAAAMGAGLKQGDRKGRILRWIAFCGEAGATQDELSQALFIKRQSMTAPCNRLVAEGKIRKLGSARPSTDGGMCAVYVLADGVEGSAPPQYGGHPVGWDSRGSDHDPAPPAVGRRSSSREVGQ